MNPYEMTNKELIAAEKEFNKSKHWKDNGRGTMYNADHNDIVDEMIRRFVEGVGDDTDLTGRDY